MNLMMSCGVIEFLEEYKRVNFTGEYVMDRAVEELLRQSRLGITLTAIDWNILLQEASDGCSLNGVLVASHKLQRKPPVETLENLLLTAVCRGDCDIAVSTSKELERELTEKEKCMLIENAILFGNTEGLSTYLTLNTPSELSKFHTSAVIAMCLLLRKKRGEYPFRMITLSNWVQIYWRELSHFTLVANKSITETVPVPGQFFIFNEDSRNKIIGALLVDDVITKECAEKLLLLNI